MCCAGVSSSVDGCGSVSDAEYAAVDSEGEVDAAGAVAECCEDSDAASVVGVCVECDCGVD